MARNIIRVTATQLVTSDANPYGILSDMPGFPITIDSNSEQFHGDIELAMKYAKAQYFKKLGANYEDTNPNRVMTTVILEMANGQQILHESIGSIPDPAQQNNSEPEQTPAE